MTVQQRRRERSLLSAAAVGVGHALLATAAVFGALALVQGGPFDVDLATQVVQASGIVALIWAYTGLLLGLVIGIRPIAAANRTRRGQQLGRSVVLTLHRQLNLVALALVLLHALVFAFLQPGGSLLDALVPFIPGPQSLGYTLGVLALYLAAILGPSYYLRDRIGRRAWLIAHQLAALSYAVALWHALALGSNIRLEGIARTATWALQIPLLALITLRLFRPRRPADQLSAVLRRGRYSGRRNATLRAAIAIGLVTAGVVILLMALLAGTAGIHMSG
ncbi:MAG: ferric reductase-like transmembrane domain-containing protein [Nakamurella sp.]